jgi:hypothetical protein
VTCGVQHGESERPAPDCRICQDERQYVGEHGQQWTTLDQLALDHRSNIRELEPGLLGIGAEPAFAIGQRALLVETSDGNVLWDCTPLLVEAAEEVERRGGLAAIAVSHPHFYSAMIEWARRFEAPVHLPAADRAWVMRPDERIEHFDADRLELPGGCTLVRCRGHFPGSAVLHWPNGAGGRGALLTGDTIQVVPDEGWVSFMYSYPNLIPLPIEAVERIVAAVQPYDFDRIYGGWWDRVIGDDAKAAVARSARRYAQALRPGSRP